MGDAVVERMAQQRTLGVERAVVAEVVPEPQRDGRQEQPLGARPAGTPRVGVPPLGRRCVGAVDVGDVRNGIGVPRPPRLTHPDAEGAPKCGVRTIDRESRGRTVPPRGRGRDAAPPPHRGCRGEPPSTPPVPGGASSGAAGRPRGRAAKVRRTPRSREDAASRSNPTSTAVDVGDRPEHLTRHGAGQTPRPYHAALTLGAP